MTVLHYSEEALRSASAERRRFARQVDRVTQIRGLSRADAEKAAYEITLVNYLNATFPRDCDPNRCARCRRAEDPSSPLIPLGVGPHAWLHPDCWEAWRARRKTQAIGQLEEIGITAPAKATE